MKAVKQSLRGVTSSWLVVDVTKETDMKIVGSKAFCLECAEEIYDNDDADLARRMAEHTAGHRQEMVKQLDKIEANIGQAKQAIKKS